MIIINGIPYCALLSLTNSHPRNQPPHEWLYIAVGWDTLMIMTKLFTNNASLTFYQVSALKQ
jgi:hypothetical protein